MSKIIAVGDVHGRGFWKEVAEAHPDFDKFVFIGDYFDNWPPHTERSILRNFEEIVAFKRANPDRVVLIIGNHDFQYMPECQEQYSGFNAVGAMSYVPLLATLRNEMQACFRHGNLLFTHAGITKTWLRTAGEPLYDDLGWDIEGSVNRVFKEKPELFRFYPGDNSGCGEHPAQSPFWVRPHSLIPDMIDGGFIQVIGHTSFKEMKAVEDKVIFLDSPKSREFLIVEDGVARIGKLEPTVKPPLDIPKKA